MGSRSPMSGPNRFVCHGRFPKPFFQTNELPVVHPSAVYRRRCAAYSCFGARIRLASRAQGTPCGIVVSTFSGGGSPPIRRPSSRSQEPRSCAFRQAVVGGGEAAEKAGMSLMEYVIGGTDREFKLKLYHALRAMDDAGLSPGITSAFRDDYRQSLASGLKAATNRSYHGGSLRGLRSRACC